MNDSEDPRQAILQMIRAMLRIGYAGAVNADPEIFETAVDTFIGEIREKPEVSGWTVAETRARFEKWYLSGFGGFADTLS